MARVLLVKDLLTDLALFADIIRKYAKHYYHSPWNLRITKVKSAEEALEALKEHDFELIISDIHLARMNGWEFIKEIRKNKNHSDLPIVVVSAIDGTELEYYAKRYGASLWFTKPVKPKEFSKQIFTLIAER